MLGVPADHIVAAGIRERFGRVIGDGRSRRLLEVWSDRASAREQQCKEGNETPGNSFRNGGHTNQSPGDCGKAQPVRACASWLAPARLASCERDFPSLSWDANHGAALW